MGFLSIVVRRLLGYGLDMVRCAFVVSTTYLQLLAFSFEDPRSDKLWLVSSPFPLLCLTSFYVWFSLRIGPKWMANRKPYNPQRLILVYNIMQILGNAALLVYVSIPKTTRDFGGISYYVCPKPEGT